MRGFSVAAVVVLAFSFSPVVLAQIPNVVDTTSTPIPGVGHDYMHMISETVNPANGSVSLRIQVPMPQGRGVTMPFSFNYDSNGIINLYHVGNGVTAWGQNITPLASGGWGYSVPQLTLTQVNDSTANSPCYYNTDYVFQDPSGGRHSLYLEVEGWVVLGSTQGNCGGNILTGGDGPYTATTQGLPCCASEGFPPVTVSDSDGTVYYFQPTWGTNSWSLPEYIEDRNGNKISFSGSTNTFTITDTLERTALSSSGFGTSGATDTLTVAGLSSPYQITWETVTAAYNLASTADNLSGSAYCVFPNVSNSFTVIKSITLPNGQQYSFSYDPTYGLLSQITYPSGGWIEYTWKLSDQLSELAYLTNTAGVQQACPFEYKVPVIATRKVGYSRGSSAAETQTFSPYDTTWGTNSFGYTWTQKTTAVSTTDSVRNQSFNTMCTYTPFGVAQQPGDFYNFYAGQIPLESQIQYYNFGGGLLRTVTKTWNTPYQLASQQTVLNDDNNLTSQVTYAYTSTGPGAQISQKTEYDYGQTSPTRTMSYAYQSFTGTPGTILDRPSSVIIYSGSTTGTRMAETDYAYAQSEASASATQHDDTKYGSGSSIPRGNATTVTQQCFPSCANAVTTFTYDETGQVLSMKDPCGNGSCNDMTGTSHTTNYSYSDSYSSCGGAAPPSGNTNAYLTKTTNPLGQSINYCYGYSDGQLRGSTDPNSQTTTYAYNDSLDRLTAIGYPDHGATTYSYADAAPTPSVTTSQTISSSQNLTKVFTMDGVGHAVQTAVTSDPSGADNLVTTYDGEGLRLSVTNPYRTTSDPTYGVTVYTYDALGRTTVIANPDSSTVQTSYTGRAIEVADEGNGTKSVQRISQTDALGRLNSLCEVSSTTLSVGTSATPAACGQDIGATGFLASYTYDVLGNLLSVAQGSLNTRTFVYDSLSRLTSSTNPESGHTSYAYDANGNVASKVAPKPNQTSASVTVTTSYQYDALNRMLTKSYNDGTSTENFWYDACPTAGCPTGVTLANPVGRLTESYTSNTGTFDSYDPVGRTAAEWQCTPQNCGSSYFPLSYAYDFLGDLTSSTNGFGVTISNSYDQAGRITTVQSSLSDTTSHPGTLFELGLYNAAGELSQAKIWGGTIWVPETRVYDSRLRLSSIADRPHSTDYSQSISYAPNGDVISSVDSVNGSWTYTYDEFNRLLSATNGSPYTYVYDRYGNRWDQYLSGVCTSGSTFCLTFDANNHVNNGSLTYDAAGNVTQDSHHNYAYDAENHLTNVDAGTTATYIYDARGNRIRKTRAGVSLDYLYDLSSRPFTEVTVPGSGVGTWDRTEVFAGARHLATYSGGVSGTTYNIFPDALGTERVRTTYAGVVCERITSLPFGDGQTTAGSCGDPSPLHFTGKERDSESGLDDFGARYDSSAIGRFMSPDPGNAGADDKDPQSWNAYAYVRNSPLDDVDPYGLDCIYFSGAGDAATVVRGDCISDKDNGYYVDGTVDTTKFALWNTSDHTLQVQLTGGASSTFHFTGWALPPREPGLSHDPIFDTALLGALGGASGVLRSSASLIGDLFGTGARAAAETGLESISNQAAGEIIGWGTGQSPEAVAETEQLAQNLTPDAVREMAAKGLTREKAEQLAAQYGKALADATKAAANKQLLPRLELMRKIITLWPGA